MNRVPRTPSWRKSWSRGRSPWRAGRPSWRRCRCRRGSGRWRRSRCPGRPSPACRWRPPRRSGSCAFAQGAPGKLGDGNAGDALVLRMHHRQLLLGCGLDHLADAHDVGALVRGEPQPEPGGVGDHVEHAAPGYVHRDGAQLGHLHRGVQVGGEGGDVLEGDPGDLAVFAPGRIFTSPAGVSRVSSVTGSAMGTSPVSSSAVTTQMVLVPDMGGYSTCSRMMKPASASGRVGGNRICSWPPGSPGAPAACAGAGRRGAVRSSASSRTSSAPARPAPRR